MKPYLTQYWNNCTVCGRFIPFEDFNDKKAFSKLVSPDSAFGVERIEYFCKKCAIKEKTETSLRVD